MTPSPPGGGLARSLSRFERLLVTVNAGLVVVLLAAMALIVFANVVLRYLTDASIVWAEEAARYLMIWMTFLGAGLALRRGLHVAVDSLPARLPGRGALALRLAVVGLLAVFFAAMIWTGLDYMERMGRQVTPATRISFAWIYAAMPTGFGLMALHLALLVPGYLRRGSFGAGARDARPPVG